MIYELTVRHHFSAGHRIPGLTGPGAKCANLHGHTFGVDWTFQVDGLDATEFEFTTAKAALRGWVDRNLDHGYLVAPGDTVLSDFLDAHGFKWYPVEPVPTTEAIASLLLRWANDPSMGIAASCTSVLITEGPHNLARAVAS